jgi:OOP family OmpA-OmpF porin
MYIATNRARAAMALALLAGASSIHMPVYAQQAAEEPVMTTVTGTLPPFSEMSEGPQVEGIITARDGNRIQVTTADGTRTVVAIADETKISATKGLLGMGRDKLSLGALLNGVPVEVKTLQAGELLVASQVRLQNKDLRTASMIQAGTNQRFENAEAATEALRSRMGDIDKYNIKHTANVYFDTGKHQLSPQAKQELCATAATAEATENALLLVVGYTDSVGDEDYNQTLSERRAGRVVNYLQQNCGWKPYRMIQPTGMAMADPAASNDTADGRAQNRRVSVNVLVSKSVDGM